MNLRTVAFTRDPGSLDKLRAAFAQSAPSAAVPLDEIRADFVRQSAAMPVGEGIEHETVPVGPMSGEWTRTAESRPSFGPDGAAILYFHGGGYILGSPQTTRTVTAGVARHSKLAVLAIDYGLAPENPFPGGIEDCVTAYRWLLHQEIPPDRIVFGGDSAGGGLVAATLISLRDRGIVLPAGGVLISPLLDFTMSSPSIDANSKTDPMVTRDFLDMAFGCYAPDGVDRKDPLVSPVFADLTGLPPMLLQAGGAEGLRDDSVRFGEAAAAAGVDVTVEVWDEMMHVWHMLAPRFPEAEAAHAAIGAWINQLPGFAEATAS